MGRRGLFRIIKSTFVTTKGVRQRAFALFLLLGFAVSSFGIPTATVYAAEREQSQLEAAQARAGNITNPHAKPLDPSLINKPMQENYPSAAPTVEAKNKPAADYTDKAETGIPGLNKTIGNNAAGLSTSGIQATPTPKKTFKEEEIMDKRTADSTTRRNKDGSYTTKQYATPKFFKKDNKWQDIDTTLVEDKNAGDSGNIFGKAFGQVQSWASPTTTYTIKNNDWQARFVPSGSSTDMVRIKHGNSQVGFSPVGAKANVTPVITTDERGEQTVHYYDLWPGVNVEYIVKAAELKENIIIKDKDATADFAFAINGAQLKRLDKNNKDGLLYTLDGALDNDFAIAPLTISLNKYGVESAHALTQTYKDGRLSINVDRSYLQGLPADAFPVAVDPTTVRQSKFGSQAGGNYLSAKSDNTYCYSNVCNPLAGSVLDSNYNWQNWRGLFFSDYNEVKGHQLTNATLHLVQRLGLNTSGTTSVQNITAWHASCLGYECRGPQGNTIAMGTVGDIDVTGLYQGAISGNDYGAWLMITGTETSATTYKNMDPDYSYVQFTFNDILPSPTINSTINNQVYTDPQVSFSAIPVSLPNTTLRYNFCVSTGPSCAGAVMNSGLQTAPLWTIPDGLLQDGNTYYVQAQSYDPSNQVYSAWGVPVPFKIDARTGKDSTQAYDTLGPISADLATGNVTTSAASHSTTALGGSLGIGLDYNSPVKSRKGLVGEYWNVPTNWSGGTPTGTPAVTRVDQAIDFNWDMGSPQTGTIGDNWYYGRWTGYFVAPTTGTYYFGSKVDDSLPIYVNNNYVNNMGSGNCYTTICYGTGVSLTAGQIVPLRAEFQEATGPAYAQMYVKGAVAEQVVPSDWLQTGVRQTTQNNGLVGSYRKDTGDHDFNNGANSVIMQRTDPSLSFDWGAFSAIPGGPNDKFMIRWTGYVTVPTSGNYQFGTISDDGSKVTMGTTDTVLVNKWNDDGGTPTWSGDYAMTANTPTRITVDFYENTGHAKMFLQVRSSSLGLGEQIVPTTWLSATPPVLPNGWNLGIDSDGNVSYDHLRVTQNSIILSDSTGSTHEYTWDASKNGYKPPVNEDGNLSRNGDGTYTFQDSDGRTYIFNANGTVQSVTNAVDDLKPAAIQYSYTGTPSKLTQITDGVDSGRWAKVYYWGDTTNCPSSSPSGFDTTGPSGMLCAVKTNDGRVTSFYYKNGNLARIQEPGSEITDYQYDTLGRIVAVRDNLASDAVAAGVRTNDASTWTEMTYDDVGRVKTVTQPAATAGANRQSYSYEHKTDRVSFNRFIASNGDHANISRTQLPGHRLEFTFGSLLYSQVSGAIPLYSCKVGSDEFTSPLANCEGQTVQGLQGYAYSSAPADIPSVPIYRCNTGTGDHFDSPLANCEGQTVEFLLGYAIHPSLGTSATLSHIVGATEPNGFTRRIEYDDLLRTTKDTDIANLSDVTVWDPAKDLVLSTTDETGLMSTTIYDDEDRAVSKYGPAPKAWYDTDRKPTSTYASQVPRTDTAYDEGMQGPAVAYYSYASTSQVLAGAPKLHSTNFQGAAAGDMSRNWGTTTPVTGSNNWGFRATGRLRLPANGQYLMRIASDNGVKLYIDDKLQLDDWNDGVYRSHPQIGFDNTAGSVHRFRLEYYHRSDHPVNGNMDANITVYMTAPGGTETATNINQYLSPDYSLETTTKTYDSTLGDSVTKTNYGSNPELGLAQSTTADPNGLNLTTTSSFETQGVTGSFLRKTNQALPGSATANPSFTYSYYGATETRDNPCTTGVTEAYKQAGMQRTRADADPDGNGAQTSKVAESIYDDAGRIVATRTNSEPWSCTSYDDRNRNTSTTIPAQGNEPARTISNDYAVGGSPLVVTTWDNNGWIVTWMDLLGRTIKYRDVYDDETVTTYDAIGKVSQRISPLGIETFDYDSYNRVTAQKLDSITYAAVIYDQYSRVDHVDYPNAGQMKLTVSRDSLQRQNTLSYLLGDGATSISDTVNRTQSADIITNIVQSGSNQLWHNYSYDSVGRLTNTAIGPHTYSYGFGPQDSSCGNSSSANSNSGKNSNRTSQVIDGVSTTFCYDYADRLISSSNPLYNAPQYDAHGNMTQIGTGSSPLHLFYDSRDRSTGYEQYDNTTTGVGLYYDRDVQGRIIGRYKSNINNGTWSSAGSWFYHYTGPGETPDYVRDSSWSIIEKTLQLPGGVNLTIKPTQSGNAQKQYSLPNNHGDILLTTDATGANTSTGNGPLNSFTYDAFGNVLSNSTLPSNTASASYGWVGKSEKITENTFTLTPISMGVRIYLPGIGRFTQTDPIEGGTENNYVYPSDPINQNDLSGKWSIRAAVRFVTSNIKRYTNYLVGRGSPKREQVSTYKWSVPSVKKVVNVQQYKGQTAKKNIKVKTTLQPTDLRGKAVLGHVNFTIQGVLTVKGNSWSFKGTATPLPDKYDFNVGNKDRSKVAQGSVYAENAFETVLKAQTRGIIQGRGYDLYLDGSLPIDESGTF